MREMYLTIRSPVCMASDSVSLRYVGGSNLNINSSDAFGYIPTKGAAIPNSPDFQDARQFELKVRLDF